MKVQGLAPAGIGIDELGTRKAASADDAKMEKAATEFEGLLLNQMIQSMWATVPQNGVLSGSREEGLYREMLHEQISKSIAEGRGIGIKEVLLRDMKKLEK